MAKYTGSDSKNDSLEGTNSADLLYGMGGSDTLNGKEGNDLLVGGMGNDSLIGSLGDDSLVGGEGNDTYVHCSKNKVIELPNQGTDTVILSVSSYTLGDNIENLIFMDISYSPSGTGNALNNFMKSNTYSNSQLNGMAGADSLFSSTGTIAKWWCGCDFSLVVQ